jgi:hypothetical protein
MAGATRLTHGELVATGSKNQTLVLRRWSPVRPVEDLTVNSGLSKLEDTGLRTLGDLAVLAGFSPKPKKARFFLYEGAALKASRLNTFDVTIESWNLAEGAHLFATTTQGELLVEHLGTDEPIKHEPLPEAGYLIRDENTLWLVAKNGNSVYARNSEGWTQRVLPDGPWTKPVHPPARIEWLHQINGEVLVGTVRTDSGFGKKKPAQIRTVYSSLQRAKPLRCGAPFEPEELAEFLPPLTASSCDALTQTPALVVAREKSEALANSYPTLASAIRSRTELREANLELINLASSPRALIAIRATTGELRKALIDALAPALGSVPEAVCAPKEVLRTLHFDAKTGSFAN